MKRRIYTPEGVYIEYNLANIFSRAYAFMLDQILIMGILTVIIVVVSFLAVFSFQAYIVLTSIATFVVQQGYFIFYEKSWKGQTPGKRMMGIRVAHVDGLELDMNQIILRNLVRVVDSLPFLGALGGVIAFFSKNTQRLGDIAAATVVLDIKDQHIIEANKIEKSKFNSFLAFPHLCAKTRKLVEPEEVKLIFDILRRKSVLNSADRVRLFDDARSYFQSKLDFPEEVTLNMPSEQYLSNLIEVVLKRKFEN